MRWKGDIERHTGQDWKWAGQDRQSWKNMEEAYDQNWIEKVEINRYIDF